jgi:eukaryotic-like serine/threonine-protein kinase
VRSINRCLPNWTGSSPRLKKDPDRRFQNMGDIKVALQELKEESESGRLPSAPPVVYWRNIKPWIIAAAATLVILVACIAALFWRRTSNVQLGLSVTRMTQVEGVNEDATMSRDGKLVAFASDRADPTNVDIWVQQVGSRNAMQVTHAPGQDDEPDFSPDGTQLAFHSARNQGGIYLVPTLGGEERLLAEGGSMPRFSPDGQWIAYNKAGKMFVVNPATGENRAIQPKFLASGYYSWSPDSKHLLIGGTPEPANFANFDVFHWVMASIDGRDFAPTGIRETLKKAGLANRPGSANIAGWVGDYLYFVVTAEGDVNDLWRIRISPNDWHPSGSPQRLTSGSMAEYCRVSDNGTLAYSSMLENVNVWSLPLEANAGRLTGEMRQLTRDAAHGGDPLLSSDGRLLVFSAHKSGYAEIWIKDLVTGSVRAFAPAVADEFALSSAMMAPNLSMLLGSRAR